eukprot:XP_001701709.1 predicted protein [Chlamydomonas reinhardtii]
MFAMPHNADGAAAAGSGCGQCSGGGAPARGQPGQDGSQAKAKKGKGGGRGVSTPAAPPPRLVLTPERVQGIINNLRGFQGELLAAQLAPGVVDVVAQGGHVWVEVKNQEAFGLESVHWTGAGKGAGKGLRRQVEELVAVAAAPQHWRRWRPPAVVLFFPDPSLAHPAVVRELRALGAHTLLDMFGGPRERRRWTQLRSRLQVVDTQAHPEELSDRCRALLSECLGRDQLAVFGLGDGRRAPASLDEVLDVAVVGGGPCGLACALALLQVLPAGTKLKATTAAEGAATAAAGATADEQQQQQLYELDVVRTGPGPQRGQRVVVRARHVIAADGYFSRVRRTAGDGRTPVFRERLTWRGSGSSTGAAGPTALRRLLATFRHLPPDLLQLLAAAPPHTVTEHGISFHDVEGFVQGAWARGRLLAVGDAAHSGPTDGQGANLAMEDAAVLGACVRKHGLGPEAFAAWEAARQPRVAAILGDRTPNAAVLTEWSREAVRTTLLGKLAARPAFTPQPASSYVDVNGVSNTMGFSYEPPGPPPPPPAAAASAPASP